MEKTNELVDILKVDGVKARGFGIIPKIAMQDPRLSLPAKAIYAYFCSFAGAGSQAFPGVKKICFDLGFTNDTFLKHRKLLEECGYIKVEKLREKGKFAKNVYTIVDNPENTEFSPCPKKTDTVKNRLGKKPYRRNQDTNNNSIYKSNSIYKNNNINKNDDEAFHPAKELGAPEGAECDDEDTYIWLIPDQGENDPAEILQKHNIVLSEKNPATENCLKRLKEYTPEQIEAVGRVLKEKEAGGKIKNAAGLLVQDPGVCQRILEGKFYPTDFSRQGKKRRAITDWKEKASEFEIFVPPMND
jgi:hypothetical protein